ncbi:hypothetical protein DPEC_G00251430 [Dallia pectoralis]|uniref:Uncharacterized protein n=1 Tax=Dallia pectoralis TaxID=75939 RepID=A0ACC2FTG2_DALPE|nr:hypothetical protein DPEC_G00251430 [Dallia pectoralis]
MPGGVEPDHDRLQRAQFIRALQPGSVQQELQREIRRRPAITFREVCTEAKALAYEIIGGDAWAGHTLAGPIPAATHPTVNETDGHPGYHPCCRWPAMAEDPTVSHETDPRVYRTYAAQPPLPSRVGPLPPAVAPTHQDLQDLREALRTELKQEIREQLSGVGKSLIEEVKTHLASLTLGAGLTTHPNHPQLMGPTWPQSSPQQGRDGPGNVGQYRWDSTGRPICLECAAARGAWDKAFTVCRRIEASEGIPPGEFSGTARLARQSIVRLPPETEMVVWAQVPRASGIPDCHVIVEDLGDSAQGYRVARTLCHLKGGKVPVRLCNPHPFAIDLPQRAALATVSQVDPAATQTGVHVSLQTIGPCEVEVDVRRVSEGTGNDHPALTLKGEGLTQEEQRKLTELLQEWRAVFAMDEDDVGYTSAVRHQILTGDAPPTRERYRPIPPSLYPEIRALLQDYRKLNAVTHKDAFPLPRIEESLTNLKGAAWYSTLDLASGYWQVEVDPKDQEKTAFTTPVGLFQFNRMPFGLCNAPATFQRLMQRCLGGLVNDFLLIYLDDIIVFSPCFDSHLDHLRQVFGKLHQQGLKLQPLKCCLFRKEVLYLGHRVSQQGYYRRFIPGFAKIAAPLNQQLQGKAGAKATPVQWSLACQSAFEKLKEALQNAPILAYANFDQPFLVYTDASLEGLGAVLSQVAGGSEGDLGGSRRRSQVGSDQDSREPLQREEPTLWAIRQEEDPEVGNLVKMKVENLSLTQARSRLPSAMHRWLHEWERLEVQSGILGRRILEHDTGLQAFQCVVPSAYRMGVWKEYHQTAGHANKTRVLGLVRRRFFWPGMGRDVENWTDQCSECAVRKRGPGVRAPMQPIVTSYPWEIVALDYLSLGRATDEYPYILVMTDLFSRYAVAVPTKDQSAQTTVRALWRSLIQPFGCPERLLTDRGGAFESQVMAQLCEMYGCTKSRTTPYHPQGNGACERFNQTLLALLGSLRVEAQAQWEAALPALVQAYNNTVHGSTGFTPYFVLFGRHARLPVDLCLDVVPPQERRTLEGWVQAHHRTLTEAYAKVGAQSRRRQGWDQARYNKKARAVPLLAGERVLLRNFRRRAGGKLAPHWVPSPFVVVAQVQPGHPVYSIRPEGKNGPTRTIHRNNLRHCPAGVAFLAERQWFSDVSGENVIRPRQGSPPRKDPGRTLGYHNNRLRPERGGNRWMAGLSRWTPNVTVGNGS